MKLSQRRYRDEEDFWRIRAFLRQVFLLNGRKELSWQTARLDYWRWHGIENLGHGSLDEDVFLWETVDGRIAAVLNSEGPGEVYLQVHPELRTVELEEEMLVTAEEHLAIATADGGRKVHVWAHAHDEQRRQELASRGYRKSDWSEHQYRRSLELPIPEVPLANGYTLRSVGDEDDLPRRSWVSWRAFHPDAPDEAYEGWEWYVNIQHAPMYRRDLDIVAVAENGNHAAFCTIWYDDVTRAGYLEPVGTDPDHQRRGLGKAVMIEGLRRLKRMGGTLATVAGFTIAANALYTSVMGPRQDLFEPWVKET